MGNNSNGFSGFMNKVGGIAKDGLGYVSKGLNFASSLSPMIAQASPKVAAGIEGANLLGNKLNELIGGDNKIDNAVSLAKQYAPKHGKAISAIGQAARAGAGAYQRHKGAINNKNQAIGAVRSEAKRYWNQKGRAQLESVVAGHGIPGGVSSSMVNKLFAHNPSNQNLYGSYMLFHFYAIHSKY